MPKRLSPVMRERRRRYILSLNPKEAERQSLHRKVIVELLETELGRHQVMQYGQQQDVSSLSVPPQYDPIRQTRRSGDP